MTVAVAHQVASASNQIALQIAAREAALRGAELAVLHIVNSLDLDVSEAYQQGLSDEVDKALNAVDAAGLSWRVHPGGGEGDGAGEILGLTPPGNAPPPGIRGRRRPPVGEVFLGRGTPT